MIDTDKYKGHTPAPWELSPDDWGWAEHLFMQGNTTNFGNAMLITDAPLLLAEVKRLREQFKLAYDWVDYQFPDGGMQDFAKYIGDVIE
tara:strand:- start:427 stop:693 length:267 start_codon:yes stop_codon:yes gene_type:complete